LVLLSCTVLPFGNTAQTDWANSLVVAVILIVLLELPTHDACGVLTKDARTLAPTVIFSLREAAPVSVLELLANTVTLPELDGLNVTDQVRLEAAEFVRDALISLPSTVRTHTFSTSVLVRIVNVTLPFVGTLRLLTDTL